MSSDSNGSAPGNSPKAQTVWRRERADRAALLLDGADYFGALRSSLEQATRSVLIVGWDIDSRFRLVGPDGRATDGRPEGFREFLDDLLERRPDLHIHLLLWDYSILYALEREAFTGLTFKWRTPSRLCIELDDCLPLGAAHHQKIAVIDDRVAYCGGLDLTTHRWDTHPHLPELAERVDTSGDAYPPFHDAQMVVDGPAASALGDLIRERWRRCTDHELPAPRSIPDSVPWPAGVEADFDSVEVGIARTEGPADERPGIQEVRALYLESIAKAQRHIYIENQYLTAPDIGKALSDRMREVSGLEVVIVTPRRPGGWLEAKTMGAGQAMVMQRFDDPELRSRVRFCFPRVTEAGKEADVMVHAKLMVVDDRILRVGSSNLNRRSMGLDSECDLVIDATSEEERAQVTGVLARLLAHHLDRSEAEITDRLRAGHGLTAIVDEGREGARALLPLEPATEYVDTMADVLNEVADREQPIDPANIAGDMFGGESRSEGRSRMLRLGGAAALVFALAALWKYTPLSEWSDPERVAGAFGALRGSGWAEAALFAAFVAGGFILFPLTVLVTVSGMVLGPVTGFAVALGGALASAGATFALGAKLGCGTLESMIGGRRVRAVRRALGRHGVLTVAALRMVPVAPFSVVNVAMGALGLAFWTFAAGTVLGLVPGILVLTVLGDRFLQAWQNPDATNLAILVAALAAWIGLAFGLQRLASRLKGD